MRINTNLDALFAQAANARNGRFLSKTLERLSTGLRINRASDDAAGLGISEKLRAQVRGMAQCRRNVQDGMAMINILEGLISSVQTVLQRMRELCLQSANDTLTATERAYLDSETQDLVAEIDRLSRLKAYNGAYQLEGSLREYSVWEQGGGGAIDDTGALYVADPAKFNNYYNVPLRVEIVQNAAIQQLDDASIRSEHVQQNLVGWNNVLVNNTITGSSSGDRDDYTIDLHTGALNPLDVGAFNPAEPARLIRSHDGGAVSAGYLLSDPVVVGNADFSIDVLAKNNGTIYSLINQNYATNGVGQRVVGNTDVESIDRVQINKAYDAYTNDPDGIVTLGRAATSIDWVSAKNWSDRVMGDIDGSMVLSKLDVASLDSVQSQNFSERFMGTAGVVALSDPAPNTIQRIQTRSFSEDLVSNGAGQVLLSRADMVAIDRLQVWDTDHWENAVAFNPALADGTWVYRVDGPQTVTVGQMNGGALVPVGGGETARVLYDTANWNTVSAAGPVGSLRYSYNPGTNQLTVGQWNGATINAVNCDIEAAYDTNSWGVLRDKATALAALSFGETVYEYNPATRTVTVGVLNNAGNIEDAGTYDIWSSYSTNSWYQINATTASAAGQTAYRLVNPTTLQVGIWDGATLVSAPNSDYDIRTKYTTGYYDIPELGAAAPGAWTYSFDFPTNTITIGRESGGVIDTSLGAVASRIDYRGWEDTYLYTYESHNKYQVAAGPSLQFAQDLYDGSDVPLDDLLSGRMEVRIDGNAAEDNYRFYSAYGGVSNVLVFNTGAAIPGVRTVTGPAAGSAITVDYTRPDGGAVDWTAATIGEDTTSDGVIGVDEALNKDGVFNDLWSTHSQRTILIRQPARNREMTVTVDPSWTVQEFMDAINTAAQANEVEVEAYWDAVESEVRLRPGTSGWKERPITGWEGTYFEIEVIDEPMGPGSGGDQANLQNRFIQNETAGAVDSIIRLYRADTGQLLQESTSWNQHTLDNIGLILEVKPDAAPGTWTEFILGALFLQVGPNATDDDRLAFTLPIISTYTLHLDEVNVLSRNQAVHSIGVIDTALDRCSSQRANYGALINRCEHTLNNLITGEINTQLSESLIRDADMAYEAAEKVKADILSNSSLMMLAQANTARAGILTLLGSAGLPNSTNYS